MGTGAGLASGSAVVLLQVSIELGKSSVEEATTGTEEVEGMTVSGTFPVVAPVDLCWLEKVLVPLPLPIPRLFSPRKGLSPGLLASPFLLLMLLLPSGRGSLRSLLPSVSLPEASSSLRLMVGPLVLPS